MSLELYHIDASWTLFLDRDGVINKRLVDDYVKSVKEFEFLPAVPEAIQSFSKWFKYIFVVTNQQGIAKGLMSENDLQKVHAHFLTQIMNKGGRIDNIYYCPDLEGSGSPNRKPEIGMARQAQIDFPELNFEKSIMIGDSMSDMKFGKKAGMKTVFISDDQSVKNELIDLRCNSLAQFAELVSNHQINKQHCRHN